MATLHHYDEIGLLKPVEIDQFTNYRYYALEQLPRIHRIIVLKDLGLSLDQIGQMIDSELPTEQLRGMLTLKEAEVQQRVEEEQALLTRIKFHIRQIDMEATMSQLDVRIKKVEPIHALTLRFIAKTHADYGRIGREVDRAVENKQVEICANLVQIVYADEYNQRDIDTEFVYPVDKSWSKDLPLASAGTLTLREIPGIEEAATYPYEGDPDHINEHLVDLQRWVAANGYNLSGSIRMVMLRGPYDRLPSDEWMMEIQHPLEKA